MLPISQCEDAELSYGGLRLYDLSYEYSEDYYGDDGYNHEAYHNDEEYFDDTWKEYENHTQRLHLPRKSHT